MPRITLIGYRGTGKSTVAALVGEILGCGWCDADVVLEEKLGCSIGSLVRNRGEAHFRDEEATVLAELLERFPGVLSTGGGAVLRAGNRDALRQLGRPIIWLTAPADVVRRRLAADPTTAERRPALVAPVAGGPAADPLLEVSAALEEREPLYRACADFRIDTSLAAPAAVATQIVAWLQSDWPARSATPSPDAGRSSGGNAGAVR